MGSFPPQYPYVSEVRSWNLSASFSNLCYLLSPAGNFKGLCKQIDHFPEDTDHEADPSEYFLRKSPFFLHFRGRWCFRVNLHSGMY